MITLSPRSYVTGAFDIYFAALLEHVYTTFSDPDAPDADEKDWWNKYIYLKRNIIFSEIDENKYREKCPKDLKPSSIDEMQKYFDEIALLKLVTIREINEEGYFKKLAIDKKDGKTIDMIQQNEELKKVRIKWAHRGYKTDMSKDEIQRERDWAEKAVNSIRKGALCICPDTANRISMLESKMKYDWITEDLKFASKDSLLKFIEEKVVSNVLAKNSGISDETRNRIERSWKELCEKAETPGDVINYFWDAIKTRNDVYRELRKNNLPTFEDVSAHFAELCYKVGEDNES